MVVHVNLKVYSVLRVNADQGIKDLLVRYVMRVFQILVKMVEHVCLRNPQDSFVVTAQLDTQAVHAISVVHLLRHLIIHAHRIHAEMVEHVNQLMQAVLCAHVRLATKAYVANVVQILVCQIHVKTMVSAMLMVTHSIVLV